MPKFFVENEQIKQEIIEINGNDVNHIVNVLRLKKEDNLLVCNKDTEVTYKTTIKDILKDKVICYIENEVVENTESDVQVTIFQGLPKADKMEYIIQKATELGARSIVPVAMRRCIVKLDSKDAQKKTARWQKIAEMAAKQSKRDAIPHIETLVDIKELASKVKCFDVFLIAYENEKENTLKQELQQIKEIYLRKGNLRIAVIIGPEGGIETSEIDMLVLEGAKVITLGNRILRTETASLAILSNIMYEYNL